MRTLNRPMFRYGGPIKEGIMNNIREPHASGGRAALVGNPMFPQHGGRALHAEQLSFWPKVLAAGKKTLTSAYKNPIKTVLPGKKIKGGAGIMANLGNRLKNFYRKGTRKLDMPKDRIPSGTGMGGVNLTEAQIAAGMGTKPAGFFNKALQFAKLNPKTTAAGAYIGSPAAVGVATGIPYEKGIKQIGDLLVPDFIFDQDKYFEDKEKAKVDAEIDKSKLTADQKRIKDLEALLEQPKVPAKSADEIRDERIQKYREIMDIKGMDKEAAYDSLIEASRAINESGDFKGDIKSGKLMNKIIQGASKAYDKPKATKDAIDTLILKGEIESDIAAGKPSTYLKAAQDMVATGASKNIQEAMKTLTKSENSMSSTLGAILAKGNRLDEKTVGVAYREETGNIPTGVIKLTEVNEWLEDNEGKNELDYTKKLLDGQDLAPGDYIIGERVVTIDEDKTVSFFY